MRRVARIFFFSAVHGTKTMEKKYLKNLSDAIMQEIEKKGCSISDFAEKCDVSYRQLSSIKNCQVDDIKFSTFVKICEKLENGYLEVLRLSARKNSI